MTMRAPAAAILGASILWAVPVAAIPSDFGAKADAVLAASYEADSPSAAVIVPEGVNARVFFDVEGGEVKGLRLRQGSREIAATRVPNAD